jgi:hypothetical protein
MINPAQGEIVADLVRKNGRILRRERVKALRLMNSLIWALEAQVPEQYLLPFSSCLHRIADGAHFDAAALPSAVGSLFNKNRRCSAENLAGLARFGARIQEEFGAATEDAVLVEDGAALAGLYQDPGAFPALHWAALLRTGICANGGKPTELAPPAEEWSEQVRFGNACWRKPKPALLVALLAGQIGNPATSPMPPMWPHLGLALLVWKDRIGVKEILELGTRLTLREDVAHGLAIVAHIFPELADWVDAEKLGIPGWERKFAVPIAARRIVIGDRD